MRERIAAGGIASLQDHETLEFLLYAFIPRKDTNAIAHTLIDTFGSFSGVLNADAERLREVPGMTANAAIFLATLPEVFRKYLNATDNKRVSLKGRGAARKYMGNRLYGASVEQTFVAALDAQDQLIVCDSLSSGSGNSVGLSVRDVVDFALRHKASSIILAHNHPSGNTEPSQQDYDLTLEILSTLNSVGVTLQDHFVFCGTSYYSFEEQGKLEAMRKIKQLSMKEGFIYYE